MIATRTNVPVQLTLRGPVPPGSTPYVLGGSSISSGARRPRPSGFTSSSPRNRILPSSGRSGSR